MTEPASPAPIEPEPELFRIIRMLARAWRLTVRIPVAVAIVALAVTFLIPPTYSASATLIPPTQQGSSTLSMLAGQLGALGGLAGATAMKTPADQYVSFLKSRNVADRVIAKFNLKQIYGEDTLQETREELADNVRAIAGKKDGLITIIVDDHDPQRATDMANMYVDELKRVTTEFAVSEASQRRVFFEAQLKSARQALSESEVALNASGISEGVLNTAPQTAVAGIARLKAEVTAQEVKIASMRGFAAEDNPDFRQAQTELAALRAQLAGVEEVRPSDGGSSKSKYTEKYRQFKYNEALFELIAKQYELARLDEAREGASIQVVDAAVLPELKSGPQRALIALAAALLAFFAVSAWVWFRGRPPSAV